MTNERRPAMEAVELAAEQAAAAESSIADELLPGAAEPRGSPP